MWSLRLAGFLFFRIARTKTDDRLSQDRRECFQAFYECVGVQSMREEGDRERQADSVRHALRNWEDMVDEGREIVGR